MFNNLVICTVCDLPDSSEEESVRRDISEWSWSWENARYTCPICYRSGLVIDPVPDELVTVRFESKESAIDAMERFIFILLASVPELEGHQAAYVAGVLGGICEDIEKHVGHTPNEVADFRRSDFDGVAILLEKGEDGLWNWCLGDQCGYDAGRRHLRRGVNDLAFYGSENVDC